MKLFLRKISLFVLPVLVSLFCVEYAIRSLPNSFKLKNEFIENSGGEIETLILGSSHTFYGLNPKCFQSKTFNFANISQSPDVDLAILKSYEDELINLKTVEPGTVVSPGTSLFEIVNISSLKFKTSISESRIATIKQGDTININVSAIPDKTFQGVVSFIAPKADEALSFPVELEVTNTVNTMLKAGMYGSVNFETSSSKKLSINRKAFVGSMSSQQVFVLKPDNTVVLTKVVTGISTENSVEIVNGLSKGDIVVTNGQINLDDGTKVKVMNKANSNNQSK